MDGIGIQRTGLRKISSRPDRSHLARYRPPRLPDPQRPLEMRKLKAEELFERVAAVDSRQKMNRPYPRADLRIGLHSFYEWAWRLAISLDSSECATCWNSAIRGYAKRRR